VTNAGGEAPDRCQLLGTQQRVLRGRELSRLEAFTLGQPLHRRLSLGDLPHLVAASDASEHQHRVFEEHPAGVLEKPPPLGIDDPIDRLGPVQLPHQVVGRHRHRGRDQDAPIAIERQERQ
jgi:hypothetical protein